MHIRPYIDTQNLENGKLNPEEYKKAVDYVEGLVSEQKEGLHKGIDASNLLDDSPLLDDSTLLRIFKAGREVYSFLTTLPEGDIASIMRKVVFGGLEEEL